MMKLNPAATITEEFAERIKSENRSAKMMNLAPLIVLACLVVVFLIVCGASFLSPKNIMNILNQMALPLVVALGLTFVIMLGSIDLSIDGSVGLAGSLFACFVLNSEFGFPQRGYCGRCEHALRSAHRPVPRLPQNPLLHGLLCLYVHLQGHRYGLLPGASSHDQGPRYYGSAHHHLPGHPLYHLGCHCDVPAVLFYSGVYRLRPAYLRRGHQ